jgi:hypothetical protein
MQTPASRVGFDFMTLIFQRSKAVGVLDRAAALISLSEN